MGPIQMRVFSRQVESGNTIAAVAATTEEVNSFLSTKDPTLVADVRYTVTQLGKYGEQTLVLCVVLFAEAT